MPTSPYAPKEGPPKTLKSVVAYLDILGFTQEVQTASDAGEADALLQRFDAAIRKWYDSLRDNADAGEERPRIWELKAFTDIVVIGHPILWDGEAELGHVFTDVALLQLGLAHEGFFVRGGIAVGSLYMDEDIVFGNGLLDAHAAEQNADAPRVVLAESAVAFVGRHVEYYASVEISPQNEHLFVDEDGRMVVSYLSSLWPDRTEQPHFDWLAKHRDVVTKKLGMYRAQPRVWAKYAWVARYHNFFCASLPGGPQYSINLSLFTLDGKRLQDVIRTRRRRKTASVPGRALPSRAATERSKGKKR